jgi:hypothetical protein
VAAMMSAASVSAAETVQRATLQVDIKIKKTISDRRMGVLRTTLCRNGRAKNEEYNCVIFMARFYFRRWRLRNALKQKLRLLRASGEVASKIFSKTGWAVYYSRFTIIVVVFMQLSTLFKRVNFQEMFFLDLLHRFADR